MQDLESIPIHPNNIKKIQEGKKSIIIKTYSIPSGLYYIGNMTCHLENLGCLTFKQAEAIVSARISLTPEETRFDGVKNFLGNKKKMYVYKIRREKCLT